MNGASIPYSKLEQQPAFLQFSLLVLSYSLMSKAAYPRSETVHISIRSFFTVVAVVIAAGSVQATKCVQISVNQGSAPTECLWNCAMLHCFLTC